MLHFLSKNCLESSGVPKCLILLFSDLSYLCVYSLWFSGCRWMYLRWSALPQLMLLEPITEHVILGPLASLGALYLFQIPIYISLPVHFVSWCLLDYLLAAVLEVRIITLSILVRNSWFIIPFPLSC